MLVRRALAAVNDALCAALGPRAVGLLGDEIGLEATPVPALGLVGEPLPSRPAGGRGGARAPGGSRSSRRSRPAR